jgi:RHS repeat-associated protein
MTAYTHDAAGRVTSQQIGQGLENYDYDSLNRLLAVCGKRRDGVTTISQRYTYDSIGNMTKNSDIGTYTYPLPMSPRPHAVSTTSQGSFQYDANGNLERELDLSGATKRAITWSHDNRPLQIITYGTNASTVMNEYDGMGRRVYRTNPNLVSTRYFNSFFEKGPDGKFTYYYFAGPMRVAKKKGTATTWFYADRLGSTRALTDSAGKIIPGSGYEYEAYGETLNRSTSMATDILFTGERTDLENGLIHLNAREYDPMLGRFISPDSIIPDLYDPQSLNRYSYVLNNPVNNVDPTGHQSEPRYAPVTTYEYDGDVVTGRAPTGNEYARIFSRNIISAITTL